MDRHYKTSKCTDCGRAIRPKTVRCRHCYDKAIADRAIIITPPKVSEEQPEPLFLQDLEFCARMRASPDWAAQAKPEGICKDATLQYPKRIEPIRDVSLRSTSAWLAELGDNF